MKSRAKIDHIERAEAELREEVSTTTTDLAIRVALSEEAENELSRHLDEIVAKAQNLVVARLKTRCFEVRESYRNSGAEKTVDADTWDSAVEAADPAAYDIMWMREWEGQA
jgi:hypothetical protein